MCSVIEVWQADGLADVFLSSASGVLENASIGRGWGSGILFEAKAAYDCTINAAIAIPMGNNFRTARQFSAKQGSAPTQLGSERFPSLAELVTPCLSARKCIANPRYNSVPLSFF